MCALCACAGDPFFWANTDKDPTHSTKRLHVYYRTQSLHTEYNQETLDLLHMEVDYGSHVVSRRPFVKVDGFSTNINEPYPFGWSVSDICNPLTVHALSGFGHILTTIR